MNPLDPSGRDAIFPLAVLFDQALLLKQFDDLGMIFLNVFEVAQNRVAVLHHELGELVEERLGGPFLKLLAAVPFGVFERGHAGDSLSFLKTP